MDYIESHECCSPEQCCKALEKEMARSTFFGHLSELKSDKLVTVIHSNKRDQKLILNKDNIIISTLNKLEKFDKTFATLLRETKQKIHCSYVAEDFSEALRKQGKNPATIIPEEQIHQLYEVRMSILFRMIDSILLQSLTIWPNKIVNKGTLQRFNAAILSKISDMIVNYSKSYHDDLWKTGQDFEIFKRLHGGSALLQYQVLFEGIQMKNEIDAVIDSLWSIDKDIRYLVYKEKEYLKLDLEDNDDWRKLLTLIKDKYNNNDH
jgi:hypothetical protein